MDPKNIVIFGDSYADGFIKGTTGAFAEALGVPAERRFAKSGSTADDWNKDAGYLLTKVCSNPAPVAVGSLLGNDLFAALKDGNVTGDEAVKGMLDLFSVLAQIAKAKYRTVVMVYPDPFFGKNKDAAFLMPHLSTAIKGVCEAVNALWAGVIVLDLADVLKPEHFDGEDIHPNADGYRAMADAVLALDV